VSRAHTKIDGFCRVGLSLHHMFYQEFPRLVRSTSVEMDNIDFAYKIHNKDDCQKDTSLMSQVARRLKPSDVCKFKNGFFVNGVGSEGTMIDAGRLDRYSRVLSAQGGLKMDPSKRRELFKAADGLNFVTVWKYPDGVVDVACECVDFFEKMACSHAYVVKYSFVVPVNCNKRIEHLHQTKSWRRKEGKVFLDQLDISSFRNQRLRMP
jgi:hypothetical protein